MRCLTAVLVAISGFLLSLPVCAADPPRRPARPAWVQQGIVMAGNWEPLSFIRRRGGHSIEDEENWMGERSEHAARELKEAGITLVLTNLHKGAGLAAEKEDIEATRRFTAFAHKYGLKVGGYIGATMMFETFFLEEPEARDWKQVDEHGRPFYYGGSAEQTFRYVACRNHPGYQAFLEKVIRMGIDDIKLDLIHFDQMEWWPEPRSCRCRYCVEGFRRWLAARYTADLRKRRFGFERLDGIAPPAYGVLGGIIARRDLKNPLMQEWSLWRAAEVTRHYAAYDHFIHSLNPETALEGNPNLNPALNRGFTTGVDIGSMLEHGDIVWSEEPAHASWTGDGRLVSKIRSFKAARVMGKSLFVYTGGRYGTQDPASPPHLRIAEAMAYNGNNLGMVGDVHPEGVRLTPEARRYIDFFHRHNGDLAQTAPVGDAAVLRAFAAVEFNPSESLVGAVLAEQTLLQHQIPFHIIFDRRLKDLSRYKVLVLAEQDALSDAQVEAIRRFVAAGGGLVATGNSSLLTEWRLRRRKFGLADVFGLDEPVNGGASVRREFGRGRVVYIPRIIPAIDPPEPEMNYNFSHEHWALPVNHGEFAEAVRWAARGEFSAEVAAPEHVTIELTRQTSTGNLNLHLVNFDLGRPVKNLRAAVRIPKGFRLREALADSPDEGGAKTVEYSVRGDTVHLRIPRLVVYDLILLRMEKQ